ncbi:MAG: bifunctional aspartate kinase/homoserine dehydrogenase I [Haliscomenobacter sp.]|uniref:bifunctional aspartate kinase/homoserine dehydrogenase I n=1 Tax=Haliscomenobacter sp. TaxID=2717303 RepID=UPI0029A45BD3|nr:bifunctional aspartate kinase/homoserine dehydrogenase I [Haliscomenobacter sp.]MDX2068534.1 bifunctional aspartate kinase/homoserine dehydrogenase I [Haliscomenobacter sp.]
MKVLKFGGSSVGTPDRIRGIVDILKSYAARGDHFTVVFSAFGGVTDALINMSSLAAKGDESYYEQFLAFSKRHTDAARDLLPEPYLGEVLAGLENNHEVLKNLLYGIFLVREASTRTMDYVISFGERNSAFIIAHALQQAGLSAAYLDARKIIVTDKNFGNAKVDLALTYENIKKYYQQNTDIQIVTGFIAAAKGGLTTTLGRGGSDYTAALIAAGLDAGSLEIWTDVDGVLTADPRRVKKAFSIPEMTYAEAMEMSHFGAKVIYPPTIQPVLAKKIPMWIKNTFNPSHPGTLVSDKQDDSRTPVKGISSIGNIALLTLQGSGLFGVPGIAARLFGSLASAGINVILITQGSSEHSISFAVQPDKASKARKQVEKEFEYEIQSGLVDPVRMENDLAVVAIIGEHMRYLPGISGRLFQALGQNGINVVAIAQGSSELNISVVINRADESKALNALHEAFFLSDTAFVNVFMVGVGLIGSTLLKQIKAHAEFLKKEHSLEVKVVGLANSKRMLFNENGIDLDNWRDQLSSSETPMKIKDFVEKMKSMNLSSSIFVDNTANEQIAKHYNEVLDASISISTPNKIATSSAYEQYLQLKKTAKKRGILFLYETNVGAGLPVISTLNDLIVSGDRILKIEAVLSGSLSFIFNTFKPGISFSSIVGEAQKRGFTEPDPRIDLNGIDVRRKLIILARETGLALESEDVLIHPVLPEVCRNAPDVPAFFEELKKADDYFTQLAEAAAADGKVLRMVASLENGVASIGLQSVDATHPFYQLSGSDNMIVFTSERYKDRPLVVRGPGAGAEVTAAGIFSEIIKIGNYLN